MGELVELRHQVVAGTGWRSGSRSWSSGRCRGLLSLHVGELLLHLLHLGLLLLLGDRLLAGVVGGLLVGLLLAGPLLLLMVLDGTDGAADDGSGGDRADGLLGLGDVVLVA